MNLKKFAQDVHENAVKKGWWDEPRDLAEQICLIHSEVSEALEAYRVEDKDNLAEELADICIRVFDTVTALSYDISEYIFDTCNPEFGKQHLTKQFCLIHYELSRALKAHLTHNVYDLKRRFIDVCNLVAIIADTQEIDLYKELIAKHEFNKTRPYKHGNKKC